MKTYAETKGRKRLDWMKVLKKNLKERAPASTLLSNRAGSWVTCACGNQCAIIPRYNETGQPRDHELRRLGSEFSMNVTDAFWSEAIDTLNQIEKRSAELIYALKKRTAARKAR